MTPAHILHLVRRWLWIVIACPLVAAGAAYVVSSLQPKVYEADVALLVRPSQPLGVSDPTVAALTSDQVAATYATLMTERPMLERVISELQLRATADALAKEIVVNPRPGTTILDVAVSDRDPALARDIANRLVSDFVADTKRIQQGEATNPNARSSDNLIVVSPAIAPTVPTSPNKTRNVLIALGGGLFLAAGLILALEWLDNTIKGDEDLARLVGLLPVGHIPFRAAPAGRRGELLALGQEPISESYKALRTNLMFATVEKKVQVLVVTSAVPGEGKSRTAANLAIALAQAGYQTLLVDADFRKPAQHRLFGRVRNVGLSNLILQDGQADAIQPVDGIPQLTLLPSGPTPPNPSELLGSGRMRGLCTKFRQEFAYVIIDTPPTLAVTDASVVGSFADACLLVIEQGRTPAPLVRHATESLLRTRSTILGAVLNKVRVGTGAYSYEYGYGQLPNPAKEGDGAAPVARPEQAAGGR